VSEYEPKPDRRSGYPLRGAAGVRGPFPARAKPTYRQAETSRSAIKATRLIVRLQAFALNRKIGGHPVVMSDAQVRAAFGLLAKLVPDLHRIDHTGLAALAAAGAGSAPRVQRTMDPAEATRAYIAMVQGNASYDPDDDALEGECSGSDTAGDAPVPVRLEEPGL
jgi:hypothetical protein